MQKEKIEALIGFCDDSASPNITPLSNQSATLAAFTAHLPLDLLQGEELLPGLDHTQTYFRLLGIAPNQTVNLRALLPKNHPWQDLPWKAAQSWQGKAEKFLTDDFARHYQSMGYNISLIVNQGGTLAREITTAIAFFVEHDDRSQLESIGFLRECGLPEPTFRVNSGNKSVHHYWVIDEPTADIAEWKRIQRNLVALVESDEHLRIPSFPMRLPGFYHVKTGNMATLFDVTGLKVSMADIDAICPQVQFTPREISGKAEIRVGEKASAIAGSKPNSLKWTNIDVMSLPFDVPIELKSCLTKSHRDLIASGAPEGKRRRMAVGLMKDLDGLFFLMDSIGQPISDDPWELLLEYAANCEPAWEEDDAARLYESEEGRSEGASLTGENLERCMRGSAWRKLKQIWGETNVKDSAVILKKSNGKGAANDGEMSAIEVATAEIFEETQCQDLSLVNVAIVGTGKEAREKIFLKTQSGVADALWETGWDKILAYNGETHTFYRYASKKEGLWSPVESHILLRDITIELNNRGAKGLYQAGWVLGIPTCLQNLAVVEKWEEVASKHLLPMANGVLNIKTKELLPHDASYRYTWQLPYAYDPTAKCDPIINWLKEVHHNDMNIVTLCQAYLAAIITGRYELHKFLECYGPGASGKSTFMNLATALVGKENTCSSTLTRLETPFETANFYRKKLVLLPDSDKFVGSVAKLKNMTGGDSLKFEKKGKDAGADFVYKGMVLVTANQPIRSKEYGNQVGRRRVSIPFLDVVADDLQRTLLLDTEDGWEGEFEPCLPGLLNWVLTMDVSDVWYFLKKTAIAVPSLNESTHELQLETHPLARWIEENCEVALGTSMPIGGKEVVTIQINQEGLDVTKRSYTNTDTAAYPNYCQWCDNNGEQYPLSLKNFSTELIEFVNNQLHGKIAKGKVKDVRSLLGLTLTPTAMKEARAAKGQV